MLKKTVTFTGIMLCGMCFVKLSTACPADSILAANNTAGDGLILDSKAKIDSMHAVVKGYRGQQNKKILELRHKIDAELCKPKSDKELVKKYVAEQASLRMLIERKWIEQLMVLKSMVKPSEFTQHVQDNWGCNCGDADCSCVPKKQIDSASITSDTPVVYKSENIAKQVGELEKKIADFRFQQETTVRELRQKIDSELSNISTNEKLIDQYVVKQSEIRTMMENKWIESLYIVKSKVENEQFENLIKGNWGCKSAEADCGCVKKETKKS